MAKRLSQNKRAVIDWLATNRFERVPATQKALASELGIHETTVSRWKQQFSDDVNKAAREKMREALPDVLSSLVEEARKGSYQHQKLYFEMVGEYQQEHKGELEVLIRYADA